MLQQGTLLKDRYEIQSVLGEGGMGFVFLALDNVLADKKVAVKEMALQFHRAEEKEAALRQAREEARLVAKLDHPRLVTVTDFFEADDKTYMVMGYVDGQTLDRVKESRPVSTTELLGWIDQICDVLDYLHNHEPPVLFRDMKPSNVMLDTRGSVRLIDFGIARSLDAQTSTSTFLKGAGTAQFAPVEQFGGSGTDARSDIYSLGATMYALLTGVLPPISVAVIAGEADPAMPRSINPEISPAVAAVIEKAMALKKEERFQSIGEMRAALSAAMLGDACPIRSTPLVGTSTVLPRLDNCRSTADMPSGPRDTSPLPSVSGPTGVLGTSAEVYPPPVQSQGAPAADVPVRPKSGSSFSKVVAAAVALLAVSLAMLVAAGWRPLGTYGRLRITTVPDGASVELDGLVRGRAPLTLNSLRGGLHTIHIEKDGMEAQDITFNVESGFRRAKLQVRPGFSGAFKEATARAPLLELVLQARQGTLVVNVSPDGSDVYIDGKLAASHVLRGARVKVDEGRHNVQLRAVGYKPLDQAISVTWKGEVVIDATLSRALGIVTIESKPPDARVLLDGKQVGRTPVRLQVSPGKHVVKVAKNGFRPFTSIVSVAAGEEGAVVAGLDRLQSAARPSPAPNKPRITDVPAPAVQTPPDIEAPAASADPAVTPDETQHNLLRALDAVYHRSRSKKWMLEQISEKLKARGASHIPRKIRKMNQVITTAMELGPRQYVNRREGMSQRLAQIALEP